MKPGDAVLVRALMGEDLAHPTRCKVVIATAACEHELTMSRAMLVTEAAIRADERRRVAEWLRERIEAEAVRYSGGRVNAVIADALRMVDDAALELDGGAT